MAKGGWKPQLKSGVPFDEVVSGLQKMIRRGKEREALILAQEMFDSGYHGAVARRLMIISVEDIGLANPEAVSQVYALCTGYLLMKKESANKRVEPLALYMSIMLLCRSAKNRECDDAQITTIERMRRGLDSAERVIDQFQDVIVDKHTERGKQRLASKAAETLSTYQELALKEFLTIGTQLSPHVTIDGNKWGCEVRELHGLTHEGPDSDKEGV